MHHQRHFHPHGSREATSTSSIESNLVESEGRNFKKVVINRELYREGFRQEILRTKRPAPGLSPPEHSLAKMSCLLHFQPRLNRSSPRSPNHLRQGYQPLSSCRNSV